MTQEAARPVLGNALASVGFLVHSPLWPVSPQSHPHLVTNTPTDFGRRSFWEGSRVPLVIAHGHYFGRLGAARNTWSAAAP